MIYFGRLENNGIPYRIRQFHIFLDELILCWHVRLSGDHVTNRLIERVNLMRLQIANDRVYVVQNLFNKWHIFSQLDLDKMSTTFLGYLDESVTGHVLDTFVSLVHELE